MRNHQMLQNPGGLVSNTIPVGIGEGATESSQAMEKFIEIVGMINEDDEVILLSVRRVVIRPPQVGPALQDAQIALLDGKGKKVAWARLHRPSRHLDSNLCGGGHCQGDDLPAEFVAHLPDVEGRSLEFRRGKDVRLLRKAPSRKPKIGTASARVLRNGKLRLDWKARCWGDEAEVWVRYSMDRGKTWSGLAVGLQGSRASLDASMMPSGTALLELSLHDGFNVDRTTINGVEIPPRPPEVGIVEPGDRVAPGSMMLWGTAQRSDATPVDTGDCRWLLDGKPVATGTEAFLPTPRRGSHKLSFIAKDEHGESRIDQEFTVGKG